MPPKNWYLSNPTPHLDTSASSPCGPGVYWLWFGSPSAVGLKRWWGFPNFSQHNPGARTDEALFTIAWCKGFPWREKRAACAARPALFARPARPAPPPTFNRERRVRWNLRQIDPSPLDFFHLLLPWPCYLASLCCSFKGFQTDLSLLNWNYRCFFPM